MIAVFVSTDTYLSCLLIGNMLGLMEELLFTIYAVSNCVSSKRCRSSKFGEEVQQLRSRLLEQHQVLLSLHFK